MVGTRLILKKRVLVFEDLFGKDAFNFHQVVTPPINGFTEKLKSILASFEFYVRSFYAGNEASPK